MADGQQVHEKIVDQIKRAIFEKKLRPGEQLPSERELSEVFNTSRVTIRSAILTLRNRGLLVVKKGTGGGTFVAEDIGEAQISDLLGDIIRWKKISLEHIIQVRDIIEPEIAALAAQNADEQDIEDIWSIIHELDQRFKHKDTFQTRDEKFHKALANAAKNPLLSVFQASLMDLLFEFICGIGWRREHKENITQYHKLVAEQVERREPVKARGIMIDHLADMARMLTEYQVKDYI